MAYYLFFLIVTFLFVDKFGFGSVGLNRIASWKKFLLIGIFLASLGALLKIVFVQGTFGQSFYSLPYWILVPAFLVLGTLIGLAEECAFRGYILRNFLDNFRPLVAVLFSSFLFGIYHINFLGFNFSTALFWFLYVIQAFTGGILMATLFYKTNRNLVGSIAYHSANIILGQIVLWMPLVDAKYLLGVEAIINVVLVVILKFSPIRWNNGTTKAVPI